MLGILQMSEERLQRPPTPPAIVLDRLERHREAYERWLLGPAPWRSGDLVTIRKDGPLGGHGSLFMVTDVDRVPARVGPRGDAVGSDTTPPPRVRKTGLREDTRIAYIGDDPELSVRAVWIEGWILEKWSVEQAEQHLILQQAQQSAEGRAQ